LDLSLTGARVQLDPFQAEVRRDAGPTTLRLVGADLELSVDIRRMWSHQGDTFVTMRFHPGQMKTIAAVALVLFHGTADSARSVAAIQAARSPEDRRVS
jgi:hypothetical protein